MRLPAKPAKDTTEKKDGLENFIVNDSDVTESDATESEEDDCEADFTSCLDADQVFLYVIVHTYRCNMWQNG